MCLLGAAAGFAATQELVPAGALWRYQDSGADLGTGWRQPAYDDASWLSGPAQLGYGDGDEATLLRSSPVDPCYYFRHRFVVTDPAQFDALSLEILRDDGAVVYLNGTEVARYNLPTGTITFNTWAATASEFSWDPPQSVPNLLVAGTNVIAVEIHQASATSTDVSFDLKLTATSAIQITLGSPAPDALCLPVTADLSATVTHPAGSNLTVNFYGRPVTPSGPDFTVVILPDIQNYTAETNGGSTAILQTQTEWIRTNREALNIVYVAQEGDLSQNGDNDPDQSEWLNASSALYSLETPLAPFAEGIPYGVAVGNHDQIVPAGDTQPTTSFNQYFGLPHFTGKSYYGGFYSTANNNNYYQLFSASGLDFLVVYFEFDSTPDQAVLDWANALLQANADRRAIVVTHYLLETTAAWGTQGLAIYNALKANPNLFLMLC
ncbi:MAG TPA: hypothetical protein VNZ22_02930, partial [Bacillota bacterium]|nr:hypothetical protein [Bacillota bacterium]